jgi:hypothetical protein
MKPRMERRVKKLLGLVMAISSLYVLARVVGLS